MNGCPACAAPPKDLIGVTVRGVYDGVLIWKCPACGHRWPRFASSAHGRHLHDKAVALLAQRPLSPTELDQINTFLRERYPETIEQESQA